MKREISIPTEIQKRVIKRLLKGESFVFCSATGTGKTLAYLLPLLEQLSRMVCPGVLPPPCGKESIGVEGELSGSDGGNPAGDLPAGIRKGMPLLLIAAPTFELCSQIKSEVDFLLLEAQLPLRSALLIGSVSIGRQAETLKKVRPEIIVGNPGRILALAGSGKLKLRDICFLVLDEADRLVQDELFAETKEMVSLLGLHSQHARNVPQVPFLRTACSATLPAKCLKKLLPLLELKAAAESVDEVFSDEVLKNKLEHWAFYSPEREKILLLRSLLAILNAKKSAKALIFTGRGGQVEHIASRLKSCKLPAAGLWGGMDKTSRKRTLDAFRSGEIRFLVSSDLAARGLDIAGISHVISLDLGEDRDVYLHRAGRTARAGKGGIMISIGTEEEMLRLSALEKKLGIAVYPKELYGGKVLAIR